MSPQQERMLRTIIAKHSSEGLAHQAVTFIKQDGQVNLLDMPEGLVEELNELGFIEVTRKTLVREV